MYELHPILEAWAGIKLVPAMAYGFRLYQNTSRLWMHIDRTQTHVISCIYHIASSDNAEPWPIVIEDYAGNTNSVILKPGTSSYCSAIERSIGQQVLTDNALSIDM